VRFRVFIAGSIILGSLAAEAAKPRPARRADPRTGLIPPPIDDLVKAAKKKDRAAIQRLSERAGAARLGEMLHRSDAGAVLAALAAIPLLREAPLLVGAVADLLDSADPAIAAGAARAVGTLLDGAVPQAMEEWEVPADVVTHACTSLRGLASRLEAPVPSRIAALEAVAQASTICTATGELATLLRDPVPAVRRATALVLRPGERQAAAAYRDVIRDSDPSVASAAVAAICRWQGSGETAPPAAKAPAPTVDPLAEDSVTVARSMVVARATPAEDAVEMLGCIATAGTPADRKILDQLRRGPPSPLRDRAAELAESRDRLKPR
jgi:hypothetical protein